MSTAQAPGTPNKRRRNASKIGSYFKIEEGRKKCTVENCNKDYALGTSSTSLIYHLRNEHEIRLIDDGEVDDSEKENDSPSQSFSAASKFSAKKQEQINEMLIKFIVNDFQPFNIPMSESFRNLLYALEPRYVLPDSKTVKQKVAEKYNKLQPAVETQIKKSDSLKSWTTDGWSSSSTDPYLILTSHFIDKEFNYFNITYDFSLFPHPHDHINMSDKLFEVIKNLLNQ
jgi:hypothetical protein